MNLLSRIRKVLQSENTWSKLQIIADVIKKTLESYRTKQPENLAKENAFFLEIAFMLHLLEKQEIRQ